jgi:amidase
MIGVIGTAPAGEGIATAFPGPHGGNMDNRYVTTGAKVHLPVAVPGALLALGDVHASMGDGEITMVGLEIAAEVTVRVELNRGASASRPWIETAAAWVTTGDALDPVEALRIAADGMASLLQQRLDLSFDDAYMLMSARCDVQVCQLCSPGTFPVTARAVFPRIA